MENERRYTIYTPKNTYIYAYVPTVHAYLYLYLSMQIDRLIDMQIDY